MRNLDDFLNAVAILLWTLLCSACGLWSLYFLTGPHCCTSCLSHNHKTFRYKNNPAAYLEYGRRMRTGFAFQVKAMVGQNAEIIKKFKAGAYKLDRAAFEADSSEFCNSLLDSIQQFDGQQVPDVLEKSHAKIANCHRLCYESVQALREAYGAEGAEQARLVKEAEKKVKDAWVTGSSGMKLHNAIWSRTST